MSSISHLFGSLRIRSVGLSATKCIFDHESGLISICSWSQGLTAEVVIALTILDENDHLEWTCMIDAATYRTWMVSDDPFQVKIHRSSIGHRFIVTTKVLRRISDINRETRDTEHYKVILQRSCTALTSSRPNSSTVVPALDLRPQLREGLGISVGEGRMFYLLDRDLILPAKRSQSFALRSSGNTLKLVLHQGNSDDAADNRKLHSVTFALLGEKCTVSLNVGDDGTLTSTLAEDSYNNVEENIAYRIVDVICPKISIDCEEPRLSVEWRRTPGIRKKKVVLVINSTYSEVDRWQISVAEAGVAMGNGGQVFLIARYGFSQRFEISPNILEVGVSYKVTVEGLQLIRDTVDSSKNFRLVCRNSSILDTSEMLALQVNLDLRIQIERSTFHQASVLISTNRQSAAAIRKWKISVKKTQPEVFYNPVQAYVETARGNSQRFDFPLQFQPAHRYQVTVEPFEWFEGIYRNPDNSTRQTVEFRAELTLEDIKVLHRKAVNYTARYGSLPCQWLYRNKSPQYFRDIQLNHGGIMGVYAKDNSGDPASPINLRINGLFFMASVDNRTGRPPSDSPFGSTRIQIEAEEMLRMASNLYFVDYYCMLGKSHYVTLVMTRPGSETDRFCAERLMPLSVNNRRENPFLFYDQLGHLQVSAAHYLWVEILFTEDIDTRTHELRNNVPTVGKGSSTPQGIPKNPACQECNLNRYTGFPQF